MAVAGVCAAAMFVSVTAPIETAQAAAAPLKCTSTKGKFVPTQAVFSHLGKVKVVTVGLTPDGAMGTPPLTKKGKKQLAWYKGAAKPGSGKGGVATDAHTWPDGSALGNRLMNKLVEGDTIILRSKGNKHRTCYRVTKREQFANSAVPMKRIVKGKGKGAKQILSVVVCSGYRMGPGNWSHRTVWTAKAIPPPKPKPKPTPKPIPKPPTTWLGGLLGGLLGSH